MNTLASALRTTELFAGLSETEAETVLKAGSVDNVTEGAQLATEGESTSELLLLLSGTVRASRADTPEATETHSAANQPLVLSQVGLLKDATRSVSVVAETPSTTFRLPRGRFEELLESGELGAYKTALSLGRDLAARVCSLSEGLRSICGCCQTPPREEDLTAFRKQLLTEWNL